MMPSTACQLSLTNACSVEMDTWVTHVTHTIYTVILYQHSLGKSVSITPWVDDVCVYKLKYLKMTFYYSAY